MEGGGGVVNDSQCVGVPQDGQNLRTIGWNPHLRQEVSASSSFAFLVPEGADADADAGAGGAATAATAAAAAAAVAAVVVVVVVAEDDVDEDGRAAGAEEGTGVVLFPPRFLFPRRSEYTEGMDFFFEMSAKGTDAERLSGFDCTENAAPDGACGGGGA